ncbi:MULTISPECIES: hypothetical protein [unclassified Crossiella]|uniref:hypothetical protein n=1 Tax=unclassified Crossiella TaxID=2620835 RepID=UPI001FFEE38B|nr:MULTISPECIES: hypothetical protein [unclassified Crossiella]MCK2245498.1 hypothetical protein [Crossiella sp. S99.2]MCK2259155.1 hypothetical protein [Crossiella sp. S99.1]
MLAWLDQVFSTVTAGQRQDLATVPMLEVAGLEAFTVRCGPALLATCAVEVYVDPDLWPAALAAAARRARARREVLGGGTAPEPAVPFRLHVSYAYAEADFASETLGSALTRAPLAGQLVRPQLVPVAEVDVLDVDTFPSTAAA